MLNQQQKEAAETSSNQALVLAGAGSGKTRALIERIAYLIEEKQVSPYEICAFTFTRKAANEIKTRLHDRIGNKAYQCTLGTMHGIALNLIRRFGEFITVNPHNLTVYSEWESTYLLREVAIDMGIYKKKKWKPPKKEIDAMFNTYYNTGIEPNATDPLYGIFKAFFFRCKENNALTYGSLLIGFSTLLDVGIKQYLHTKHLLVDEIQDINRLQWDIIGKIVGKDTPVKTISEAIEADGEKPFVDSSAKTSGDGKGWNVKADLFIVGDIDQCQPAGTMVLTTKGEKLIEDLDPETDELQSYCKHDALIYGGHNRGYKFKISHRLHHGQLYTVKANEKMTHFTSNHKWWVKWADNHDLDKNVVYLMRQGDRFRVGWCQLFKTDGCFHLGQRARIEKADAAWILKVFDNKRKASLYEHIVSIKYGLPTIMFEPTAETIYYDREGIDDVFRNLGDRRGNAYSCLIDHGRSSSFPFWDKERKNEKQGSAQIFGVVSWNLVDGLFKFPLQKGDPRKIMWIEGRVSKKWFDAICVYSLNVEKYHTYVADGICTRNSIYEWRGAVPEYLVEIAPQFDVYRIETNYRSDANIVHAANRLIEHNADRLPKTMVPFEDAQSEILEIPNVDSEALVKFIKTLRENSPDAKRVVLARVHNLLAKVSRLLEDEGIEHTYIGKKTALTNSEDFRRFHAFFKLIVNPFDNFSFLLAHKIMAVSRETYNDIRVKASQEHQSHFQTWQGRVFGEYRDLGDQAFKDFATMHAEQEWTLKGTLLNIRTMVDVWYAPCPGGEAALDEIQEFVQAWVDDNPSGDIRDYLEWLATFDIQDEMAEEQPLLSLMTIHAAKGLEWPTVIIAGFNEGLLPSKQAIKNDEIESERRLAYVAITRAEDRLILTTRPTETVSEKTGTVTLAPASRFIKEMQAS